ncbi:hypothetical protein GCM10025868_24750 [Angustibacter aerolatus]|uniref:Uncharacterized protein n=1 Tax=Angustibacter aerolatus TaxID=1162965 RepID=A0ABQ6JGA9_9ACTN|nr:hypothetical protein GCM10025868_24750 [Angustibacter aerolatus]
MRRGDRRRVEPGQRALQPQPALLHHLGARVEQVRQQGVGAGGPAALQAVARLHQPLAHPLAQARGSTRG